MMQALVKKGVLAEGGETPQGDCEEKHQPDDRDLSQRTSSFHGVILLKYAAKIHVLIILNPMTTIQTSRARKGIRAPLLLKFVTSPYG